MFLAEEMWYDLLRDYNHWIFETVHDILQFIVIGVILLPLLKRGFNKWLQARDAKMHPHQHCEDVHEEELIVNGKPVLFVGNEPETSSFKKYLINKFQ